jgi:hypothetical protein
MMTALIFVEGHVLGQIHCRYGPAVLSGEYPRGRSLKHVRMDAQRGRDGLSRKPIWARTRIVGVDGWKQFERYRQPICVSFIPSVSMIIETSTGEWSSYQTHRNFPISFIPEPIGSAGSTRSTIILSISASLAESAYVQIQPYP